MGKSGQMGMEMFKVVQVRVRISGIRRHIIVIVMHIFLQLLLLGKGLNDAFQRLFSQNLKSLFLRDLRKLNIVLVELLLHDLLEYLQGQRLRFGKGHLLVIRILQTLLGGFRTGTNSLGFIADKCTRGVGVVAKEKG